MDEQNNTFQSPVQPQQPRPDSVVQPQQPFAQQPVQPQQPFGFAPEPKQPAADPYAQQPFAAQPQQPTPDAGYQPQQPYGNPVYQQPVGGAPTAPPPGYVPGSQPAYGYSGSYQPPANTGKATGALICGIAAIAICLLVPFIGAPIGIVLGIVAIVLGGSFIKQNGPFGRAKAGRICGIVGLVLSILSLVLVIIAGVFAAIVGVNLYDDLSSSGVIEIIEGYDYTDNFIEEEPYVPFAERLLTSEEQAAVDRVSAEFDALIADDAAIIANIGVIAEEGFYEATGLTFEQCGIDSTEYALAITDGLTYLVDEVDLYGDGTGYVGVSISCKDIYDIYEDYYEELAELASAPGAEGMSDEEYNQRAGQILMTEIHEAEVEEACNWAIIDIEGSGSEWDINQETWNFEMDYMFSLV